ncbi:hypothetical protein QTL95_12825 [Rhizobium sp. S152]|uniref:hypothetical protein n=1 Tax=Rhizobium sp. S152 TaxID=3055038 RepID=UPI0025A9BBDB|nr:hypothetical protein [Rhizobium sp. S152]MDM9626786.1 hypothetical protein [Rhizobium sp. S152]
MQWVAAALLACGCVSLVEVADWPDAADYVAKTSCGQSENAQSCTDLRARWTDIYGDAIAGKVESQRIVARCLSTGCDGAVEPNAMRGCAWWQVIVKAENASFDINDQREMARSCGPEKLDDPGRQAAADLAKNWLILLGVTARN